HELADTFRGDVGEVERTGRAGDEIAVLVLPDRGDARGRHRAAVEGDEVVARTETTDSHARAFTVDAIDRHAGDALERFREVGVGELADVFGGNAVDDTRRIALEVDRSIERSAHAGDDDRLRLVGCILGRSAGSANK